MSGSYSLVGNRNGDEAATDFAWANLVRHGSAMWRQHRFASWLAPKKRFQQARSSRRLGESSKAAARASVACTQTMKAECVGRQMGRGPEGGARRSCLLRAPEWLLLRANRVLDLRFRCCGHVRVTEGLTVCLIGCVGRMVRVLCVASLIVR